MKEIIHALHVHAPPADVYGALTTEEGVTGWWTTEASLEEGEGGVIAFTFHGDFHPRMEQTALEPGRLVKWRCVGGHENWADNAFSFALEESDGETRLTFRQHYARELPDQVYGTYNYNWGYYLGSLKKLCETGEGTPFEPPG